jgi:hypothetical protein
MRAFLLLFPEGRDQIMICDAHEHYIPKKFSEFMGDRFTPAVGVPNPTGIARHPVSD